MLDWIADRGETIYRQGPISEHVNHRKRRTSPQNGWDHPDKGGRNTGA